MLTFSHELDALCWVLGRPTRLTALASHVSSLEIDTEDVAEITLQFPDGALGSVHVDYVRRPPRRTLEVVGEKGVVRWEYDTNQLWLHNLPRPEWPIELSPPRFQRNEMYVSELRHFVDCTVRGAIVEPLADGHTGAQVLEIALVALRSASEGRTVDLHE